VIDDYHLIANPAIHAGRAAAARGAWAPAATSLEQAIELLRLTPLPLQVRHAAGAAGAARATLLEARTIVEDLEKAGILARRLADTERRLADQPEAATATPAIEELSAREREVLRLLPSALSEAEIGGELFISYHTVHSHIRTIYRKLGTSSRAQTVERARAIGLLPTRL